MRIIDWNEQPIQPSPHNADIRLLYKKSAFQVQHIALEPGEALMPHYAPVDVTFYVLEGKPTIQISHEMFEVGENKLIESPKYSEHCIYNHTNKFIRVLAIKPSREERNCCNQNSGE